MIKKLLVLCLIFNVFMVPLNAKTEDGVMKELFCEYLKHSSLDVSSVSYDVGQINILYDYGMINGHRIVIMASEDMFFPQMFETFQIGKEYFSYHVSGYRELLFTYYKGELVLL